MKKHILILAVSLFAILFLVGTAGARPFIYKAYIGKAESGNADSQGSTVSGNTTVASGTSDIVLSGEKMGQRIDQNYVLNTENFDYGNWTIEISSVTPSISQQSAGGDKSGVSYTVIANCYNDDANSSNGSTYAIIFGQTIGSSSSPYQVNFTLPYSRHKKLGLISGVTPLDGFNAVLVGNIPNIEEQNPQQVGSMVFTLSGPNSGTSTTASDDTGQSLPAYAQYGELINIDGSSGVSMLVSYDGKTFDRSTAEGYYEGEGLPLNRDQLEKLQIGSAVANTKAKLNLFSRKPE